MSLTVAITALCVSAGLLFFTSIAASFMADGSFPYPRTAAIAWLILGGATVATAFLAGSIWP